MRQTVTINPTIGAVLRIEPVFAKEHTLIRFRNKTQDWPGAYTVTVWNSDAKNTEHHSAEIETTGPIMDWIIKPEEMGLPITGKPTDYYVEIFDTTINRIIFRAQVFIKP